MITAVIIDDEQSGIEILQALLAKYCPQIKIVGLAGNITTAKQIIANNSPQLVFLDIEMPHGNAFDLLAEYTDLPFEIIFVTAFEKYALKALRIAACDYILKPIQINELTASVTKAEKKITLKNSKLQLDTLLANIKGLDKDKKIALPTLQGMIFIRIHDIINCSADGSYTWFYFTNREKLLVTKNLGEYEDLLEDRGFLRVHHAHLINTHHIAEYRKTDSPLLIMSNGASIPVSRRKQDVLMEFMQYR